MGAYDLGPVHPFHVESILAPGKLVLSLEGELDIGGLEELNAHVRRAARRRIERVVLDLRALTFIDGSGVRAVVGAARGLGERAVVYPGPPRVHRVFELTGTVTAVPFTAPPGPRGVDGTPERNVEFVRRLWEAFRTGGADAMARLIPSDAEWRPSIASGRVLRGPDELRSFWAAQQQGATIRVTEFRAVGNDVLVRSEYTSADQTRKVVWSLYQFREMVLLRAETYNSEREALAHAA